MFTTIITSLQTINQLLTAGIAITAFSLLIYALTFNLRDRVARSFALILFCIVVAYVCDSIGSVSNTAEEAEFWLRLQWVGLIFLPATFFHFSDALLSTTGRPSRGLRRNVVRVAYIVSIGFLISLALSYLVGPYIENVEAAPYLARTWLSWVFTAYYIGLMALVNINVYRAYKRTVAHFSQRRMGYLLLGSLVLAIGSFPYLLFGSGIATAHSLLFWLIATINNALVSVFLVIMAYAAAFFGVSWPDRVVRRRLFKWLMRGPVTASLVLTITTLVRRVGNIYAIDSSLAIPIIMVASVLILEHIITLVAPVWERYLFHGRDHKDIETLQRIEERLLTSGDLRQFLESILSAVCDRLQTSSAFVASLGAGGVDMMVTVGKKSILKKEDLSADILVKVTENNVEDNLFVWGDYWLTALYSHGDDNDELLGLLGVVRQAESVIDNEQMEALSNLTQRAGLALEDRRTQQKVFSSLEELTPGVELIQQMRAAARYDSGDSLTNTLTKSADEYGQENLAAWVKDALTHYWGGPKLTKSPLLRLRVVQQALDEHKGNPTNALRAILRRAVEYVRPEGDRRFTPEWILYNILELKFMQGRKVRNVAMRLAMSEADLYRKQRVAVKVVADAIIKLEEESIGEGKTENNKQVE